MESMYRGNGIQFRYPDCWELSEEAGEGATTVSVHTDETAFWSITVMPERPPIDELLKSVRETFEQEYEERDFHEVEEAVSAYDTVGFDVEFVCLELINTAVVRTFRTGRFSIVILFQGYDGELIQVREEFEKIGDSLVCEFGDDVVID